MRGGIYGRYSLNIQQPTSIDDQVRRCRSIAEREGITISDELVFSDEAITGKAEGTHKRIGYKRLLDAWDEGLLDIVYADEVSRFSRDLVDGAKLMNKVETTGVHIVTGDGIDTRNEGWQTLWVMRLAMSSEEVRSVARRTSRTMKATLDRGAMIAPPPFGYRPNEMRVMDENGKPAKGAQWVIDEAAAAIVRNIFARRKSGLSCAAIAKSLNDEGVACPRTKAGERSGYWRPATVHRLLTNQIYKGTFVYMGSGATRAKLAKKRLKPELVSYERPQFRLVDDALWDACNQPKKTQRVRGGSKHLFATLVQCGDCGCSLSVGGSSSSRSLHCPQCEQAVRVGQRKSFIGYTSVGAARQALEYALRELFTEAVCAEFASRLRGKLLDGPSQEEERLKARRQELLISIERLKQLARRPDIGLDFLADQLGQDKAELEKVEARLKALAKSAGRVSKAEVERQLSVRPEHVLKGLLEGEAPVHEVRATLKRLIESFRFVKRPAKFQAQFEIRFVPGAFVADLAQGEVLDDTAVAFAIHTKTGAKRPTTWDVTITRIV